MAVKNGKTVVLPLRVDEETRDRFRSFAERNNFSQAEAVRVLLALWPSRKEAE